MTPRPPQEARKQKRKPPLPSIQCDHTPATRSTKTKTKNNAAIDSMHFHIMSCPLARRLLNRVLPPAPRSPPMACFAPHAVEPPRGGWHWAVKKDNTFSVTSATHRKTQIALRPETEKQNFWGTSSGPTSKSGIGNSVSGFRKIRRKWQSSSSGRVLVSKYLFFFFGCSGLCHLGRKFGFFPLFRYLPTLLCL